MSPLSTYVSLVLLVTGVTAGTLFKKYYHKKIDVSNGVTYPVRGILDCEKLCRWLGDSCKAANAIYEDDKHRCEVMKEFPYTDDMEIEDVMKSNPGGKLIIKRGIYCCVRE